MLDPTKAPHDSAANPESASRSAHALADDASGRLAATEELERLRGVIQTLSYTLNGLSHDVREPIRTINCYTEKLSQSAAVREDPNLREYAHFIIGAAGRIEVLLHRMLEYARLLGEDTAPQEHVDLNAVVQNALANLQLRIDEVGAAIVYDSLPTVLGDPVQLTELFQNLIGNSLKYHKGSGAEITIRAAVCGGVVTFSIRDNGIGIDPRYHEAIFAPFKRLHGRNVDGVGLGLAICRRIVERHGGRIWVDSRNGDGSTFHFTLRAASNTGVDAQLALAQRAT